jgi:hypothetical protein
MVEMPSTLSKCPKQHSSPTHGLLIMQGPQSRDAIDRSLMPYYSWLPIALLRFFFAFFLFVCLFVCLFGFYPFPIIAKPECFVRLLDHREAGMFFCSLNSSSYGEIGMEAIEETANLL